MLTTLSDTAIHLDLAIAHTVGDLFQIALPIDNSAR
jgi:hypothetical protein